MTDDVAAQIAALIPRNLADIVRRPGFGCCRLPTEDEVAALRGDPDDDGRHKATLDRWRIVSLDLRAGGASLHHVLVGADGPVRWATSVIVVLGAGAARTRNGSLYRLLGSCGEGEPPEEDLIYLCLMLHKWGIGRTLGVPEWS
ncbi:hypothetical protein HL658_19870 [Azospirillum sp. RWY-5-1]|uniref:Uncharacterized protein n=1 Tax=Azospirillum oleiclasticum TaxID=2735135 RepID=A0ABX2TGE4_9PROT|nr:hypothetical protein [Azospirillum oleiclasticum]NYZ14811.1 hypothetical protein [Azospirillum oleiclasticum]NYZ22203.1 hypothetical protein [Azospirillum oleiclasticum]